MAPPALAQSNDAASIEEVVVTGSRIKRQDEVSNSPIQTLNEDDLRIDGSLSIGETLQTMPSVGSSLNSNGSAGTSHGSSSINLRNLGENRSLVLVNGHRWVNGAGTRGFRDFVDYEHDPAGDDSARRGAAGWRHRDLRRRRYRRRRSTCRPIKTSKACGRKPTSGSSSESDRDTTNIDLLFGRNFGATNLMFAVTYVDQDPIYTQDRSLTAIPLNGLAVGTPEGLFREAGLAAVVGFTPPTAGITRDPGADGSVIGNWRAVDYGDRHVQSLCEQLCHSTAGAHFGVPAEHDGTQRHVVAHASRRCTTNANRTSCSRQHCPPSAVAAAVS